jgi:hypothetical protein
MIVTEHSIETFARSCTESRETKIEAECLNVFRVCVEAATCMD